MTDNPFTFLALGDSYTIGEAVDADHRWPVQLARKLGQEGIEVEAPTIVATTGWTTDELIAGIEQRRDDLSDFYSLVSLLIGVNNQYRGYPIDQYERGFSDLLKLAIGYAEGAQNVFVVSIPDYGVTPFAAEKELDPNRIATELDQYNEIAKIITEGAGATFIDITAGSKAAKDDPSLTTTDGLHPSEKMYLQWVEAVFGPVYDNLSTR